MKKFILGLVLASSLSVFGASSETVVEITTAQDYEDLVARSTIPVIIDFYADWCQPCKKMIPIFKALAKEYAGKVRFVKIDTGNEVGDSIADQFNIRSIPTFVFKKGQSTSARIGIMTKEQLKKVIDSWLAN